MLNVFAFSYISADFSMTLCWSNTVAFIFQGNIDHILAVQSNLSQL